MKDMTRLVKKVLCMFVCFIFFFVLVFMLAVQILEEDKKMSQTENRVLATFPDATISNVVDGSFMTKIEEYFSDQFYEREKIVSAKTVISRLLGKKEINDVYLGSDNRLFEVPSEFDNDKVQNTITSMNSFSGGCKIENKFLIIAPNATEIYPDNLPKYLELRQQEEEIKQIYSNIESDVIKIDAVHTLKASNDKNLYFKTDHHWTSEAAFLVFDEFMEMAEIPYSKKDYEKIILSNSFYGTLSSSSGIYEKPDEITAILPQKYEGKYYVHNLDTLEKTASVLFPEKLKERNHYEVFFGGNYGKLQIQTDNLNSQSILIIKDSYANCFIPLLIPYFEKIVVIDPRYFSEEINNVLEDNNFTHLLYVYNLNTFVEDVSLSEILG